VESDLRDREGSARRVMFATLSLYLLDAYLLFFLKIGPAVPATERLRHKDGMGLGVQPGQRSVFTRKQNKTQKRCQIPSSP
jgi:hypothetical protein